jgi:RNA polymerase sigma-70 factor (ECF subfamily)
MQLNDSINDASKLTLRASIPDVLPALEARAMRLTRSRHDAEDLLQETVVRALRFEDTFQRGTNLRAWMQQILQSVFISRCRRRVRERRAMERFTGDPTLTTCATAAPVLSSVSTKMHDAYSSLPDKFREVIELVDLRDFSYREAADFLGVPVGTVMSRLFRARRMLAESLGTDSIDVANEPRVSAAPKSSPSRRAAKAPKSASPLSQAAPTARGVASAERFTSVASRRPDDSAVIGTAAPARAA